jgi:GT2 family glycosyltransferase
MSVTVVVPTYQRRDLLVKCLDGVLSQMPPPDDVVVVVRPDDLESIRAIQRQPIRERVRRVDVAEAGHVPPVRAALQAITTDLVAFIDDDAVPESGWLAALVDIMRDPTVACTGGHVHTEGKPPIVHADSGRIRWYGKHVGNVASIQSRLPLEVDAVMEGNSCWRTHTIRSLEFHPVLARDDASMYGLDLCLQAKERGARVVYTSAARIVHTPGPRRGSSPREDRCSAHRSYSRNYTLIAMRHFRGVRWVAFVLWWWIIGERGSYGAATGVVDLLAGRAQLSHIRASFEGKAEGVRSWRDRR